MDTSVHVVEEFNMEDFGFESIDKFCSKRAGHSDRDYIIYAANGSKGGKSYIAPYISLSNETAKFVESLIGDNVNIGINNKGFICLSPGTQRRISHGSQKKPAKRGTISIGSLDEKLKSIYGDFRCLYIDVQPYAKFNAVILKPTGEMETE